MKKKINKILLEEINLEYVSGDIILECYDDTIDREKIIGKWGSDRYQEILDSKKDVKEKIIKLYQNVMIMNLNFLLMIIW